MAQVAYMFKRTFLWQLAHFLRSGRIAVRNNYFTPGCFVEVVDRRKSSEYTDMSMSVGTAALLSRSFLSGFLIAIYVLIAFIIIYALLAVIRDYDQFRTTFTSTFRAHLTDEHEIYLPAPAFQGEFLVSVGNFRKDYIGKVSITGFAEDVPVGSFCTRLEKPELIRIRSGRRGPEPIVVPYNFDKAVTGIKLRLELEPAWTGRLVREFGIYPEKGTQEIVRVAVNERRVEGGKSGL